MLPSQVPQGWTVASLDFDQDEDGASFALGLTKGEARLNFLTTNDGIGDPPGGARTSRHPHQDLGEITIEHEEDGEFLSDWMEVEGGWSALAGSGPSDSELDQFVQSLTVF